MKYLSLFSGIEAATQAWKPLGWEAVAFSEIEPFPCAVLSHHYPNTPNLGDITKITEVQIKELGQIDLVVFGSPCQDLSVAGKREGLNGERSGLFKTAINIINWARKHGGARFALWENVPGAFSSNTGKDFAEVIRLLCGASLSCQKWATAGIAIGGGGLLEWRVLDAQYFGVPQRRRRIFALADFGSWANRQPILFEQNGVRRHIKTSKKAEKGFANIAETLTANCGGLTRPAGNANELDFCIPSDRISKCLTTGTGQRYDPETESFAINERMGVRRLTPLECEKLQGFPDNFTQIPYKNKNTEECPDSPRYKALGNSMAVPVVRWIGERINKAGDNNEN